MTAEPSCAAGTGAETLASTVTVVGLTETLAEAAGAVVCDPAEELAVPCVMGSASCVAGCAAATEPEIA